MGASFCPSSGSDMRSRCSPYLCIFFTVLCLMWENTRRKYKQNFRTAKIFPQFFTFSSPAERNCREFCCFEGRKSVEMVPVNALQMLIFGAVGLQIRPSVQIRPSGLGRGCPSGSFDDDGHSRRILPVSCQMSPCSTCRQMSSSSLSFPSGSHFPLRLTPKRRPKLCQNQALLRPKYSRMIL